MYWPTTATAFGVSLINDDTVQTPTPSKLIFFLIALFSLVRFILAVGTLKK